MGAAPSCTLLPPSYNSSTSHPRTAHTSNNARRRVPILTAPNVVLHLVACIWAGSHGFDPSAQREPPTARTFHSRCSRCTPQRLPHSELASGREGFVRSRAGGKLPARYAGVGPEQQRREHCETCPGQEESAVAQSCDHIPAAKGHG